jgi:hypothetical protein
VHPSIVDIVGSIPGDHVQVATMRELHYPVKYKGFPSLISILGYNFSSIRLVLRGHCSSYTQGSSGLWLAFHLQLGYFLAAYLTILLLYHYYTFYVAGELEGAPGHSYCVWKHFSQANLCPICLLLLKLRKLMYKIIHSTTIILPVWRQVLRQLNLDERIMPCDVTTQWNSTFDMLDFAIVYRATIDKLTGDWSMELCDFELQNLDWEIAKQLRDTLLVFKDATLFFS